MAKKPAKEAALEIIYLPIGDLIAYANNSRVHTPAQIAQIARSMREFGWTNPVLIDEAKNLIAGHARILAAQTIGLDRAPCIQLSHLSEPQKKALVLADNKLAENACWNPQLLAVELKALGDSGFDATLAGFESSEIGLLLQPPQLKPVALTRPPKMSWVLIGIPTVEFGGIQSLVDKIAAHPNVLIETVVTDAHKKN